MPNDAWYSHDMNSVRNIMTTCIGPKYGQAPEEFLDEIREHRYRYGKKICRLLKVDQHDVVLDIGSGCGFVTRSACELAKEVHCLDISQDFLDFTANELSGYANTHFHKIDYARFADIGDGHATKAFSTAVFIHFNYYDILFYLIEINRVLQAGGCFFVDIIDADVLTIETMAGIKNNIIKYTNKDRGDAQLMHPYSLTAFTYLADQLGFKLESVTHFADVAEIVFTKTSSPTLPGWLEELI